MRVLRVGMDGADIESWEAFLRGQGFDLVQVDGKFEGLTLEATKAWQRSHGLSDDGVVGPRSYGKAQELGFDPGFEDEDLGQSSPNWPPKPAFTQLSPEARVALLGQFAFEPAPTDKNPEGIRITDDWPARHIQTVDIPELVGLTGAPALGKVRLHERAVDPFRKFFAAVDAAGLKGRLISFGGSWVPRFVRGSRSRLSNHAYGSAIDLNVPWNQLGTVPALHGKHGSVRELVPIANEHGLYWGGHFSRADGMHFELARP